MANYSTDQDLQTYEPKILDEGVSSFEDYHALAKADIDRILKADWWPAAMRSWASRQQWDPATKAMAEELRFDPQYLKTPEQLKAASSFRVLGWYAYEILAKYNDTEPDRYEKKKEVYRERFKDEMALLIAAGIDYDFSRDGTLQAAEEAVTVRPRRTRRG